MADPILSALCSICHIHPPKYRCPRCSTQTCSLPCSKRHKVWSSCNGERDPTVYKPRRELATPAGIDHDYNFISAIERRVQRSEREIIDERGLLSRQELDAGVGPDADWKRAGPRGRFASRRTQPQRGAEPLLRACEEARIRVLKAPKGMQRNSENATSWNKRQKCVNWQVEWKIQRSKNEGLTRILGKVLETQSIALGLEDAMEEDRRAQLSEAEKKVERKRRADEVLAIRERAAKRMRESNDETAQLVLELTSIALLQSASQTWSQQLGWKGARAGEGEIPKKISIPVTEEGDSLYFYLHRPRTLSSQPPVLIPIDPSWNLRDILQDREVLEFPSIFILPFGPTKLPSDKYLLESDYLRIGNDVVADELGDEDESSEESESSETSSEEDDDDDSGEAEEDSEIDDA